MDLGLHGKVAAITGGSEGIGRAVAYRLAAEGARVAVCARRQDVLEEAASAIAKATGAEVLPVVADVTRAADCERFVRTTVERFGSLEILVNNAGRSAAAPFSQVTEDDWRSDLELKLFGAIRCCQLALPHMLQRGWGRIVNITHVGGKQPGPASLPTSVSRAAGIALTKALSKDYAAHGITVNTVCVGRIKSGQWERRWRERFAHLPIEEYYRQQAAGIPMGRFGEAEEVADLVAFLVSERAGYITGASVNIDGGVSGVV
ncbi:MAG TPA: SDR family oxidoreductase [Chloroflexota bacterium]|jgi:NAD(P)-dependent dehydrogenase (short-subunit alcohol dehydrogenase family)